MSLKFGYGFLPLIWSIYTFLVFLLCYLLAVHYQHVYPFVPAISDTGAYPPEGNIFGELFSFSAYVAIVNVFVRYLQLQLAVGEDVLLARVNKVSVIFGVLSSVGATIIANFQSKMLGDYDYLQVTHDTGAVLLFGSGAVYFWLQTILTYKLTQTGKNSTAMFALRLLLSLLLTTCGAIFFVVEIFAYQQFCGYRTNCRKKAALWRPEEPGYALHVLSNSCEWAAGLFFGLYTVTFFGEFQKIRIGVTCSYVTEKKGLPVGYSSLGHRGGESDDESEG